MTRLIVLVTLLVAGTSAAEGPVSVRRLALLVGVNDGGPGRDKLRYATIDQWESYALYERFKKEFAEEYARHDRHCERFSSDEKLIGYFELLG